MPYPRQPSSHLSDDLDAFRASVASFVDREVRPHADAWETAGEFPRELYRTASQAGLLGLRYDERWGGGNGSYMATCVMCEELVKGVQNPQY